MIEDKKDSFKNISIKFKAKTKSNELSEYILYKTKDCFFIKKLILTKHEDIKDRQVVKKKFKDFYLVEQVIGFTDETFDFIFGAFYELKKHFDELETK